MALEGLVSIVVHGFPANFYINVFVNGIIMRKELYDFYYTLVTLTTYINYVLYNIARTVQNVGRAASNAKTPMYCSHA